VVVSEFVRQTKPPAAFVLTPRQEDTPTPSTGDSNQAGGVARVDFLRLNDLYVIFRQYHVQVAAPNTIKIPRSAKQSGNPQTFMICGQHSPVLRLAMFDS
jgi:hypothetical protein